MIHGLVLIDDVVDVIREGADHSLMSMAGLDEEEDTFIQWKLPKLLGEQVGLGIMGLLVQLVVASQWTMIL